MLKFEPQSGYMLYADDKIVLPDPSNPGEYLIFFMHQLLPETTIEVDYYDYQRKAEVTRRFQWSEYKRFRAIAYPPLDIELSKCEICGSRCDHHVWSRDYLRQFILDLDPLQSNQNFRADLNRESTKIYEGWVEDNFRIPSNHCDIAWIKKTYHDVNDEHTGNDTLL